MPYQPSLRESLDYPPPDLGTAAQLGGMVQQEMKRLGKGTGKHAARHRQEAREYLEGARGRCRRGSCLYIVLLTH